MAKNITRIDIPVFAFRYWHGRLGECRLRLYKLAGKRAIVVATELNTGVSVTNAAEFIHAKATKHFDLSPDNTLYIEHYAEGRELLDVVIPDGGITGTGEEVKFSGVHWKPIPRVDVEKLIGEELE